MELCARGSTIHQHRTSACSMIPCWYQRMVARCAYSVPERAGVVLRPGSSIRYVSTGQRVASA
eukprot:1581620-Rhodomonas_salina.2